MFHGQLKRIGIKAEKHKPLRRKSLRGKWSKHTPTVVADFKEDIKKRMYDNQSGYCAYCGLRLSDGVRQQHIEHIADKARYPKVTYHTDNLVLSCARCNMDFKGTENVVVDSSDLSYGKWTFSIVHPYFDDPNDFFEYNKPVNGCIHSKKKLNTTDSFKAENTIKLFDLNSEYLLDYRRRSAPRSFSSKHMNLFDRIVNYRKY